MNIDQYKAKITERVGSNGMRGITGEELKEVFMAGADAMQEVQEQTKAGISGIAQPNDTIPATGFFQKIADTAQTYTNYKDSGNAAIVVTAADLDVVNGVANNRVILRVNNGVATKIVERVKGDTGPAGQNKINTWVAGTYTTGQQVIYDGKVWEANAAIISTDVPGVSPKWDEKVKGADVSKLIIKAGTNAAAGIAITSGKLLQNTGSETTSAGYFFTDYIEIKSLSLKYKTELGTNVPAVVVYDKNKALIAGKNASQMTNTAVGYVERTLDDDFDFPVGSLVRISCKNGSAVIVTYSEDIIINHTISNLQYGTDKPINSDAVKGEFEAINSKLLEIQEVAKDVEEMQVTPFYVEPANYFMRGFVDGDNEAPNSTFTIASRDNDYQFTASGTGFVNGKQYNIAVFDGTNYHPIKVVNYNSNVFKVADVLPTNCVSFQNMFSGIHLSRFGGRAYAKAFVDNAVIKTGRRNKKIFGVYTNDANLTNTQNLATSTETLLTMTKLTGSTISGGWIDQPNGIIGTFQTQSSASSPRIYSKYSRDWLMNQNVAGAGLKFTLTAGIKGYIRVVCGLNYREGIVSGKVNIKAYDNNGTELYNKDAKYGVQEIIVPVGFQNNTVTFEISLLTSATTQFAINEIEVFKTYLDTSNFVKKNGLRIMFLCDSWGEFPNLESGETAPKRPDGSTLGGLAEFPAYTKSYLQSLGYSNIEIYNFSRGSQTSKWGDYWVEEFIKRCPQKPDYCVVNFYVNDANSAGNVAGNTPSVYDFSPTDPYAFQQSNVGGVFASTNSAMWVSNLKSICEKLKKAGIRPIIVGYPQLSKVNIEFATRNNLFLKEF